MDIFKELTVIKIQEEYRICGEPEYNEANIDNINIIHKNIGVEIRHNNHTSANVHPFDDTMEAMSKVHSDFDDPAFHFTQ